MAKKCSGCNYSCIVEGFGDGTVSVLYCYHREVVIKDHVDKVSYPVVAERARLPSGLCGPEGRLFEPARLDMPDLKDKPESPVGQGALKTPWTARKARPATKRPPPYKAR